MEQTPANKPILPYSSMFCFGSDNRFRLAVHAVVTFPFFDTLIMIIIVLSSIALAAEDPVEEKSARNRILTYFDYIFTSIFAVEMVLKVVLAIVTLSVHISLSRS